PASGANNSRCYSLLQAERTADSQDPVPLSHAVRIPKLGLCQLFLGFYLNERQISSFILSDDFRGILVSRGQAHIDLVSFIHDMEIRQNIAAFIYNEAGAQRFTLHWAIRSIHRATKEPFKELKWILLFP